MQAVKNIKGVIIALLLVLGVAPLKAQSWTEVENNYKYRVGASFDMKIIDNLKLEVSPQLRYAEGYDMFVLDGALSYKTFGCITWGASYRLMVDRLDTYTYNAFGGYSYDKESYHRYAFDVTYKEKFGRFTPSVRLQYNNYTDQEIDDEAYLRYRAKVEYDIPKCKLTPSVGVELYQELEDNMLYKTRYSADLEYKFTKRTALGLDYKLDFFALKYKNNHIFSLTYSYTF